MHYIKFIATTVAFLALNSGCSSNSDNKAAEDINHTTTKESSNLKTLPWKSYSGECDWSGSKVKQSATNSSYPLILLENKRVSSVDISVDFKPISGNIDASGGVVFRAVDSKNYYIVRANALENNFRLYTFKNGYRSQIATATVDRPALNKWHTIRVVADGNNIKAYLDGKLQIDHNDSTFTKGYIGLWTKEDSVTIFNNITLKDISK